MKRIFFLLIFLLFSSSSSATEPWSTQDIVLESTWLAFHLIDWGQALDIADQLTKYSEVNPILGKHPSRDKVHLYFGATALAHLGITYILPQKYRPYWQMITIGISATNVFYGFSAGLHIRF